MFWGLVLEPGKRYSTTVEKSFHVSKAALDCTSVRNEIEILSVMLETEGSESLLCNLCKQKGLLQESLDLNFMTGDRLTFECRGHGRIHLSGYLLPDDDDDMSGMIGDEEESEEEEMETTLPSSSEKPKKEKRKLDAPPDLPSKKKKIVAGEEDGDSGSEDEDSELSEDLDDEDRKDDDDEDVSDEDDDDEEDEDDDESDEEDDEDVTISPKEKQKQQHKQDKSKTPNKQAQNTPKKSLPVTNGLSPKEQKSNKKPLGGDKTPNANSTPKQKLTLDHGVIVRDLTIGSGAPAKSGKMISVHYLGRLKDSGKVFDKQLKGDGFKFKLGKGEVIKGWDIGLQGMKVGGKRLIYCPPEAAYGAKGVPPKIPPNCTLAFEVTLKGVN